MSRHLGGILSLTIAGACLWLTGCHSHDYALYAPPTEVKLPLWFTMPQGDERADTPVSLGARMPQHLIELAEQYGLPHWVIYGVVRSLGADEFLANGTIKTFSVADERGESSVVVDDVYDDVASNRIRSVLQMIAIDCSEAETERERENILGSYVRRRYGGIVLFSLAHAGELETNLLLTSGATTDPMEEFGKDGNAELPEIGWQETATHYINTVPGNYMYGNPVLAFRRTEENAIRDLAKTLMLKFSHMGKTFVDTGSSVVDDAFKEDVYREEITLRLRGVRVLRRAVDMDHGLCLVQISVPRSGVALK